MEFPFSALAEKPRRRDERGRVGGRRGRRQISTECVTDEGKGVTEQAEGKRRSEMKRI